MEKKQKVTIRDVAGLANVSVATVSRVLNGYKWINEEVRQRVLNIIEEVNFVPNYSATAMARGASKIIVVMVPIIVNPFFTQLIDDVINAVKKHGYYVVVYTTNDSEEELSFLHNSLCRMADGIINVTSVRDICRLKNVGKPMIILDRNFAENDFIDSIINDNKTAVHQGTAYLAAKGHKEIALLMGRDGAGIVSDKIEGYREGLLAYGIPFREELCIQDSWRMEEGILHTKKLLDLAKPPTAILAGNNFLCRGVMEAARDLGITIGQELSLIGFEESETDTRFFEKEDITVIRINTTKMAIRASELLIQRMEQGDGGEAAIREMLKMDFIERNSVKDID